MCHILYVYADLPQEWNVSQWRSLSPADVINASGRHTAKLLYIGSFANYGHLGVQDIVGKADVIVIQRNFIVPEIWAALDYWRGFGKPIIADLDDGYPTIPWCNPAHTFWLCNESKMPDSPIALMAEGLRRCDALASPSRVILDDWKDVLPGVYMPNFAPRSWYKELKPRALDGKIVIGWGGSMSHRDSWEFSNLRPALQQICAKYSNVVVKICGNDKGIADALDLPADQKIQQGGVPAKEWAAEVMKFDIGLAPLDIRQGYNSYDQRRSSLKGIEYMLAAVPWIATESEPYKDLAFGLRSNNTVVDWVEKLEYLIEHIDSAKVQAEEDRAYALEHLTIETNVDFITEQYSKVVSKDANSMEGVYYVHWDHPHDTRVTVELPKDLPEIKFDVAPELCSEEILKNIQQKVFKVVDNWIDSMHIPMDALGVNLTKSLKYDMLQRANHTVIERLGKHG